MDAKKTLQFPKLAGSLLLQVIYYTLTEVETFLLALTSAFIGYVLGWEWGVALFLASYTVIRFIGGYVALLAAKLHMIATATAHLKNEGNDD